MRHAKILDLSLARSLMNYGRLIFSNIVKLPHIEGFEEEIIENEAFTENLLGQNITLKFNLPESIKNLEVCVVIIRANSLTCLYSCF